ncbi:MAG TPA: glutathione-regulated potassium-efflux system protein KefC, partial [Methylotenera sp.]|nr:glutathione-regulated potassium-efflux system protein KefC [Methylotenera sp.]
IGKLVKARWPNLAVVTRARSRTDAFDLRDIGLDPIRETFYSSLVAAKQALLAIGESPAVAAKIIKHFEQHDLEQLEATRTIRHDMNAVRSMAEKGRQDLKDLLLLEQAEIDGKETMKS